MPAFDMIVVGSGGGPCENDLSAYLLKPHGAAWTDGIVALEAGSGMGTLKRLLERDPCLFDNGSDACPKTSSAHAPSYRTLYDSIRCYLISHAHLDHVNGLILSAGSLSCMPERRRVRGLRSVLDDLALAFGGRLWPALASFDPDDEPHKLLFDPLPITDTYTEIIPNISVRVMPISHGWTADGTGTYDSTAFFVRHIPTASEFLFLGDVEPDTLSARPRTHAVWAAAARRIPGSLSTLFIECSWPADRKDQELYGHLSPVHLHAELCALACEVVAVRTASRMQANGGGPARKRRRRNPLSAPDVCGALRGLRVFIIHCKDATEDDSERPVTVLITEQVKALVDADELGAEILHAAQGMRISTLSLHSGNNSVHQPT
ncbi:cAMP phosphodiesterases class-II-domain-containing protein [Vararia minispora EC-137]|uniref:cAMP phosphodiesterases class-II-domain-containing protein n=1 Tax=Vararia minispora EC-137 TaxID=1314806 RepID=A0ACB8Q9L3_9AGAM|nr:cAMP phosphodiesterases class-II-domain-containing protein [Vararia minispora EC-137]